MRPPWWVHPGRRCGPGSGGDAPGSWADASESRGESSRRRSAAGGRRRGDPESGRIAVLVCGLLVVVISLICVVTAITQVATAQRRLLAVADAAAASSLESFDLTATGDAADGAIGPGGTGLRLNPAGVDRAVRAFVADAARPSGLEGVRVESVSVAGDGVSVRVELSASVAPGLTAGVLPLRVGVSAAGLARLGLSE